MLKAEYAVLAERLEKMANAMENRLGAPRPGNPKPKSNQPVSAPEIPSGVFSSS